MSHPYLGRRCIQLLFGREGQEKIYCLKGHDGFLLQFRCLIFDVNSCESLNLRNVCGGDEEKHYAPTSSTWTWKGKIRTNIVSAFNSNINNAATDLLYKVDIMD